jgi:hypothetical protein
MTLPKVSGGCRMAQPINGRKPSQTQTSVASEPNTIRLVNAGFWLNPELLSRQQKTHKKTSLILAEERFQADEIDATKSQLAMPNWENCSTESFISVRVWGAVIGN